MSNIDEILKKIEGQNVSFVQEFYLFCEDKKRLIGLSNLILSIFPVKHINNLLVADILLGLLMLPVLPLVIILVFCCMLFRGIIDMNESEDIRVQSLIFFLVFLLFGPGMYLLIFGWSLGIVFILYGLFASYYLMPFRLLFIKEWTTYYISCLEYCHKQLFYFFCVPNPELVDITKHVQLINKAFESVKNIDRVMYIFHEILLYNNKHAGTNLTGVKVYFQDKLEKSTEEITQDQLASHLHREYLHLYKQLMRVNTLLHEAMQTYIGSLQQSKLLISQTIPNHDGTLIQIARLQNQRLERQIEQFQLNSEKLLQMSNLKISIH